MPARLAVVGAGASGAEIASAFARLGSEVLLLEALERVLPTEDGDISRLVERGLKRQGISVHTSTPVADVSAGETSVSFSYGSESAQVDYLVIAAGRGADIEGLGLAEAGVELDERGLVRVDGALRTSRAGVYAIGDLVPGPALAHKASDEGIIAAETIAGRETHPIAYADIPRATFCTPNVGSFGLTEEQAREQGHDVVVGKVPYGAVGRRHGVRRPHGPGEGGRREPLRRAARRAHRRLASDRADPGARERARARGRLPGAGAHHPRAPDAVRGRDGSWTRGRRLADPRLKATVPRRQTPPAVLGVQPARLRSRASSAIHGPAAFGTCH